MGSAEDMAYLLVIALTVVLSWVLTGLATWYASRLGLLDHPGDRHSHRHPTPRGGGAGLVLAMAAASTLFVPASMPDYWLSCALPGFVVLAITGWWDDHRSLSVRLRILVQLAVTVYLLACVTGSGWIAGMIPLAVAGLFVIWMTNLYNFMDGSNGMAGLQGVFAGSVLAALYWLSGDGQSALLGLLLAAACAGFLPWNLGRARVFMGDVGSLALGFGFAAVLVHGVSSGAFTLPVGLLVMLLFLTDATLTLLARVIRGERWYNAHRQHLYQRLIAHGWSHGRVAMLYQAINLALVLPGIGVAVHYPVLAWPVTLLLVLVFSAGWLVLTGKFGVLAKAG
ncbi:MAG: glycosyltransferase family 4 protein [Xanthomonadales bacterium]|jgi:UDP-N-acetylmuramyl pentapeptide phosphotransferase/UDP-N-acetylglucosamine-1-phosphate transferase|nr:glycosyltransferase family 4 protein [Xanthomonadales bacterium]